MVIAPPVGAIVSPAVGGDDSVPGSPAGVPVATSSVWLSPPATTATTITMTVTAATAAAICSQAFPRQSPDHVQTSESPPLRRRPARCLARL